MAPGFTTSAMTVTRMAVPMDSTRFRSSPASRYVHRYVRPGGRVHAGDRVVEKDSNAVVSRGVGSLQQRGRMSVHAPAYCSLFAAHRIIRRMPRQYELGVDFYFIRITKRTDKMIKVFRKGLSASSGAGAGGVGDCDRASHRSSDASRRTVCRFIVHDLGNDDNRFLDVVVESVKVSAGINLRIEVY